MGEVTSFQQSAVLPAPAGRRRSQCAAVILPHDSSARPNILSDSPNAPGTLRVPRPKLPGLSLRSPSPVPRPGPRSPQAPPALSGKLRSGQRMARGSRRRARATPALARGRCHTCFPRRLCGRDALRWRQRSGCGLGLGARSDRNLEGAGAGAGRPGSAHGRSLVALKSQLGSPAQLHCRLPPPLVLTPPPPSSAPLHLLTCHIHAHPTPSHTGTPLLPPHLRTPTRATVMHTDLLWTQTDHCPHKPLQHIACRTRHCIQPFSVPERTCAAAARHPPHPPRHRLRQVRPSGNLQRNSLPPLTSPEMF